MKLDQKTLETEIIEYIRSVDPSVFGLAEVAAVKLTPLSTGYQNINFIVELNGLQGKRLVIRFHPDNKDGTDKSAIEAQNMALLAELPIPKVIYVDRPAFVDSSVIIMEFIKGKNIDFKNLSLAQIKGLAEAVAEMHGIRRDKYSVTMGGPASTRGDYQDYLSAMVEYSLDRYLGPLQSEVYREDASIIQQASEQINEDVAHVSQYFKEDEFSLLHTDLGKGNVLWNGDRLTIIDWEEVTFGDPADEISYIFMVNELGKAHQNEFLKAYLTIRDDPSIVERMLAYSIKNRLFDLLWSIYQLHYFGHGKASEASRKSIEVYEENYRVRREALEKTMKQASAPID